MPLAPDVRYVEVGPSLKHPMHPVWVVCSESHYSLLFAMPSQAKPNNMDTGGSLQSQQQPPLPQCPWQNTVQPRSGSSCNLALSPPIELYYYDGLARQEGPIKLVVSPAQPGCGWTERMVGVAQERGVWRGQPIPPLECVLETCWPNLHVSWHGCEPLL
jgi:hypothetical protein